MPVELKARPEIKSTQCDKQVLTTCNVPRIFTIDEVQQAKALVLAADPHSPGFAVLQKLAVCQSLAQGEKIASPFVAQKYLTSEVKARRNYWLPTIGVELELPYESDYDAMLEPAYRRLIDLQIRHDTANCKWEFKLPFSYSWKTQAALLHRLLDLQYIPYRQVNGQSGPYGRSIHGANYHSLHINLGIPENISFALATFVSPEFEGDAHYLAMASGLAFALPQRLLNRKTDSDVTVDQESDKSDKSASRAEYGRVEIRTLGFGHSSSYRQLLLIQEVGSALLAYYSKKPPFDSELGKQQLLSALWVQTRDRLRDSLDEEYNITTVFNGTSNRSKLKEILYTTNVQAYMFKYLCTVADNARNILWS